MKYRCLSRPGYISGKILLPSLVCLICQLPVFAQLTLRVRIVAAPTSHLPDSLFVAGNFNGWDPGKNGSLFLGSDDTAFIGLADLSAGRYEFKLTRGNWQTAECLADGKDAPNRLLNLSKDTMIQVTVAGWKDDFAPLAKQLTTSPNVRIIDTAFPMPELGRTRRIWLYLPPGYKKSNKRFPVIYMQDGQNIFDEYTSGFGEWGVDECIDTMIQQGKPGCIVVGIDNGPQRMNEYNPYEFQKFGKGEGDRYADFIVQTLKPCI